MNFDADIRTHILNDLPYDASKRAELDGKTTSELLIIHLNWRNRFVMARPRRVHKSQALTRNPVSAAYKAALDQIASDIAKGEDLTHYLSRAVRCGYESSTGGRLGRRADLDLMLGEWNVHHLHLSTKLEADGFVERTEPLLFVAIRPDDAYLIDIYPHQNAWTREAIMHVLIDEFPNSGVVPEVPSAIGLDRPVSERERALLRSAGITSPLLERNGKVYMVGFGGITSAGTPVAATRHANFILRSLKMFEEYLTAHPEYITDSIDAIGIKPPATPDLHFVFFSDGSYGVLETKTSVLFPLVLRA